MTSPPVGKLREEIDPESDLHWLLFDPSPEAEKGFIEKFLTVQDVKGNIVPFHLFPQQFSMLKNATGRDITVKGRQTRASSLLIARRVRRMMTSHGRNCLMGANDDQTTALFRSRVKHHFRDLSRHGFEFNFDPDNDDELGIKDLDSRFIFQSGMKKVAGRSFSAQEAHISELAHWPQGSASELIGGIEPAIPGPPHGNLDYESTPKGAEGIFYEKVQDTHDPDCLFTVHFYPWWMEPRYRVGTDDDADIILSTTEYADRAAHFRPTEEEERLMQTFGLRVDQILWRRIKKAAQDKTEAPFLQEYVETIDGCFLTKAGNYFMTPDGIDHLAWYRLQVAQPVMVLESLTFRGSDTSFKGPNLALWEFPHPGDAYIAYMDCSSGEMGPRTDFTAANVVNVASGHKVARLRLKVPPREAGEMLCAVGAYYNMALLGVERGGYGQSALERVAELGYPYLFYQTNMAKPNAQPKPGIYPTAQTRQAVLQSHREAVIDHTYVTRDGLEVAEMGTFDWVKVQSRARPQAQEKREAHDDLVIAGAGCSFMLPYARLRRRKGPRQEEEIVAIGPAGRVIRPADTRRIGGKKPWLR